MADIIPFLLYCALIPKIIYPLAVAGSIAYLGLYKYQGRFASTTLPDFINTGFQIVSICGGTKLVLTVLDDLIQSSSSSMEMGKFYTGYGGAAVLWIAIVALRKRFKKPE